MSIGARSGVNGFRQTSILMLLHQEGDLPVVVAQRRDAAVVGPVEKLLAWARLVFALEEGIRL